MKHYGDITKLNGADLPPVDVITGGSPCQDLSVAGKRAGLDGERSGLFMDQVRIVKQMREKEKEDGRPVELIRPRFMVWENVPGAFSSNGGKDFQAVLTEIVRIVEPDAPDVPMPDKGKWTKSGCVYDEMGRWSIAWRVHDAQFWGVPQRRKRIALVADFGGLSAPEILFERKGLSGDFEPCGEAGQETAGAAGGGVTGASGTISFQERGGKPGGGGESYVMQTAEPTAYGISAYESNAMKSSNPHSDIYEADTARTLDLNGGSPACNQGGIAVVQPSYCLQGNGIGRSDNAGCSGKGWTEEVSYTLNTIDRPAVVQSVGCGVYNQEVTGDVAASLTAASGGTNTSGPKVIAAGFSYGQSAKDRSIGLEEEVSPTLRGGEGGNQKPCVYDARGNGGGEIAPTITGDHQNRVTDYTAQCVGNGQLNQMSMAEQANTLDTMHDQQAVMCFQNTGRGWWNESDIGATVRTPCEGDSVKANLVAAVDCRNGAESVVNAALKASASHNLNSNNVCRTGGIVRRLTPLECERLQGYPDGWTDIGEWTDTKGKKHQTADSARYKALGNSIALPFWKVLARRISAQYDRDITMGSLFDGIGGFPLAFEHCGGKAVWASEIEEFPIAVTKVRFPEPDDSKE